MIVNFDAYWWVNGPPSGKSVLRAIVRQWIRDFPEDEIRLSIPRRDIERVRTDFLDCQVNLQMHPVTLKPHGVAVMLEAPMRGADVIISQNFTPLRKDRARRVTFIHDAIFRTSPEWFTRAERAYLSLIGLSARQTDAVVTSTYSEAERIKSTWPFLQNRVHAVGLGLPEWAQVPHHTTAQFDASLRAVRPERPYLLTVGRLNVRKNIQTLITAFEGAPSIGKTHDLVIVGESDGRSSGFSFGNTIKFVGRVTNEHLSRLYANAVGFVFPSLDEGFGMPLLEAAAHHLPIAASDIPPFREIGAVDEYFDPRSPDDIAGALERLLMRTAQKQNDRLTKYEWGQVVESLRAVAKRKEKSI